jgi:uncharacterized membrane protein YqjE
MTEPDVALTDYAVALECACFVYALWMERKGPRALSFWFITAFLATAVAGVAGGTVHGFFNQPGSFGHGILWPLSLVMIGVAALAFTNIASALRFTGLAALAISRAAFFLLLFYCVVIVFFNDDFKVAIAAYLPAVLFLGWVFLERYRQARRSAFAWGLAGIGITLLAAVVQQARIALHPRYFNHNAVYHTLQAAGLFMIFLTARDAS